MRCIRVAALEDRLSDVSSRLARVAIRSQRLEDQIRTQQGSLELIQGDTALKGDPAVAARDFVDITKLTGNPRLTLSCRRLHKRHPVPPVDASVSFTADMALEAPLHVEEPKETQPRGTTSEHLNILQKAIDHKHPQLRHRHLLTQEEAEALHKQHHRMTTPLRRKLFPSMLLVMPTRSGRTSSSETSTGPELEKPYL